MKASDVLEKIASDNKPASAGISQWGLPEQEVFPLDTQELVKLSAQAFEHEAGKLTSMDKIACARRINSAAGKHGLNLRGMAAKLACDSLSPYFPNFMRMRNIATTGEHGEKLAQLSDQGLRASVIPNAEMRKIALDKLVTEIEAMDKEAGIDIMADEKFPNPAYTVYGPTLYMSKDLDEPSVKVANYEVVAGDLDGADWSRLDGKIDQGIVDGLRESDDKLQVFSSLPAPHREIIAQSIKE
jgi:hypothetical protein